MRLLSSRRRIVIAGTAVAMVFAGAPVAFAADDPALLLKVSGGDLSIAKVTGFEANTTLEVTALVKGGSGTAEVKTTSKGVAVIAFEAPAGYEGTVSVTAKAGEDEATGTAAFVAAAEETPATGTKPVDETPVVDDEDETPAAGETPAPSADEAPATDAGASSGSLPANVKVMAMGDSITQGGGTTGAWRGPIFPMLEGLSSHTFDFVGGEVDNAGPAMSDKEHEGHSGWTVDGLNDIAQKQVSTYKPDLVVVLAGTNDMIREPSAAEANERMKKLIDSIWAGNPNATIIIGEIPPMKAGSFSNASAMAKLPDYNALNKATVEAMAKQGKKISFAPMSLQASDLQDDGVHMLDTGNAKLAEGFFAAIKKLA